jgi:hypothetical protein
MQWHFITRLQQHCKKVLAPHWCPPSQRRRYCSNNSELGPTRDLCARGVLRFGRMVFKCGVVYGAQPLIAPPHTQASTHDIHTHAHPHLHSQINTPLSTHDIHTHAHPHSQFNPGMGHTAYLYNTPYRI